MQAKFTAKKSLGQHFLRSEKAINQIVGAICTAPPLKGEVGWGPVVFEIGPGEGVLTEKLLEAGKKLIAIEIDKRSIETLQTDLREYIASGQLTIIEKDCLEIDYEDELLKLNSNLKALAPPLKGEVGRGLKEEWKNFVLVGNIPYYITGAIFRHTFEQKVLPKQAIFLVQKEVAQRVVARDKKESILSVSVKIFTENENDVEIVDIVKAGSFAPPPKVDSAILNIKNIKNVFRNTSHCTTFFSILKAAFSQKRKFLMSNLRNKLGAIPLSPGEGKGATANTYGVRRTIFQKYEDLFQEIFVKKYSDKVRAEDVNILDWKELIKNL